MKKIKPRQKRRAAERLSTRLLTVFASVLASALLMVGLAIYAESQPIVPPVQVLEAPETTEQPAPTSTPTPDPTLGPTPAPTPEPTPLPSAYTLSIIPPSGWYKEKATVLIRVIDENNTGWQSVTAQINANGPWYDLTHRFAGTEYADIEISENCTIYLTVTGLDGKQHTVNQPIECMDRELPAVRAAINGDMLRATAKDNLSGIAAITVCDQRFTDLADNLLLIRIQDYLGNYEFLVIQAEDAVGNLSNIIVLENPFYDSRMPTPKPTPTSSPTPKPTAKPTPALTKSTGSGNSQGSTSATNTPAPSVSPEPEILLPWDDEPEATPEPALEPTPEPTPEPVPEETLTIQPGTGFTSTGNAVARDLLYDKHTNKQFIRVEAREGSSYFLIIDYDKPLDEAGESYETYFLNMVDSRDLLDVIDEDDVPERYKVTTPAPTEIPIPTPMPTAVPPEPTQEPAPPAAQTNGGGGVALVVLLIAGGGGALWYFKFRKPKEQGKKKGGFDDFDWEDDEDEEQDEPEESDGEVT